MKNSFILAAFAAFTVLSCSRDALPVSPQGHSVNSLVKCSLSQAAAYSNARFNGINDELKSAVSKICKRDEKSFFLLDSSAFLPSNSLIPTGQTNSGIPQTINCSEEQKWPFSTSYFMLCNGAKCPVNGNSNNEYSVLGTSVLTLPVRF